MRIRNKITLWITGAGLAAGLLFSAVIALELIEQPYELLDDELNSQAHTLLAGLAPDHGSPVAQADTTMLDSLGRLYWLKVFNSRHKLIYSSAMTDFVDLPLKVTGKSYNISTVIPPDVAALEQDDSNEVTFRVRAFTIVSAGQEYLVQIARPMEKLQEELVDLIISIAIGLLIFTITLLLLGYFAAGKILQPISDINTLARDISDKTLGKRIPLGRNKDELYTLSSSLNQMFDRLQFSFKHQKEFIANASHELKTPIALQRLYFDEALQRQDLPEQFQKRLVHQAGNLLRMDRLVKNLLDLSALELGETCAMGSFDLSRLAASVLAEFEEIIQAANIQIEQHTDKSIYVQADKEKLRRMLINLLDNALKYNKETKGKIRLTVDKKGNSIHIEVANTGPGIPADDIGRVFNQFYRVEKSRSTAFGGSGLGLTIVQRIVGLHHGTIEITSDPGSWTEVHILLPASSQPPA